MLKQIRQRLNHASILAAMLSAQFGTGAVTVSWGAELQQGSARVQQQVSDSQIASTVSLKMSSTGAATSARQIAILVDTSASQVGEHRTSALSVLENLLSSLGEDRPVRIYAVDVRAESLQSEYQTCKSEAVTQALQSLKRRVPLGATDLPKALSEILPTLPSDGTGAVVYIGDGMSTFGVLDMEKLGTLVDSLRTQRVAFHGMLIGPRLNPRLMGILALQSGGTVQSDYSEPDFSANVAAGKLAQAVAAPVFFADRIETTSPIELLPSRGLPVRGDRATTYVVAGQVPADLKVRLSDSRTGSEVEWTVSAPVESPENVYLVPLVRSVKADGGMGNFLAGDGLMTQVKNEFLAEIDRVAIAGNQDLKSGKVKEAAEASKALAQFAPQRETVVRLARDVAAKQVAQVDEKEPKPDPLEEPNADDRPQMEVFKQQVQIRTQILRQQTAAAIDFARRSEEAEVAREELKRALAAVKAAIDIAPEDRATFSKLIETELRSLQNRQDMLDRKRIRAQERLVQIESQQKVIESLILDEERLFLLFERIRALMDAGRHGDDPAFGEAEAVALVAVDMRPGDGTTAAARFNAEAAQQLRRSYRLREKRADQFLETLHQVELSHIPFPDEPPVRFPPAEVWWNLTQRRAKWKQVDLKQYSPNEQRIYAALEQPTDLSFENLPLTDVIEFIEKIHNIDIAIDEKAFSDAGVEKDELVTIKVSGIRLKNALRLMLTPLTVPLTYIVEDEVLKITTVAAAESPERMPVRVYPVADLVIPLATQLGGGIGAGGGGGLGGGGLGGGGGVGGVGGGGGGGFFNVPAQPAAPQLVPQKGLNNEALKNRKKKL